MNKPSLAKHFMEPSYQIYRFEFNNIRNVYSAKHALALGINAYILG